MKADIKQSANVLAMLRQRFGKNTPVTNSIEEERKFILGQNSDFFIREAYKALRTNVVFALADEDACKVVIVTSAMQSEGKSITAVNLAISFAEMNNRVLIVDCDLRRPKLSRLLQMNARVGLSNVLLKPALLDKAIQPSKVENLDVLPTGDVPPNPSELLGSAKMHKLLDTLRERYDYIILDTSPVNMVTDACVLVPESSGVLFVVRANRTERDAVRHAVEQLEYSKAKIMGLVLNGAGKDYGRYSKYRYGKYKRYGYHQRYGYGCSYGYGYGYESRPAGQEREE